MVLINKNIGNWCIFIKFIDLNRSCPKDSYHLLNNDKLVENSLRYMFFSFIDTDSEYNDILMHGKDKSKTTFKT